MPIRILSASPSATGTQSSGSKARSTQRKSKEASRDDPVAVSGVSSSPSALNGLEKSSTSPRPWWRGMQSTGSRRPYDLKHILKDGVDTCQYAEFFPFTGSRRPEKTRAWRDWDRWEDAAVYCVGAKVVVGGCVDKPEGASWEPIWQVDVTRAGGKKEPEQLFHVTWTVDPFTLHPIIIAGGNLGLIYVLDPVDEKLLRILRGHGDQVQALAICPRMPHILASGSRDHTTRIWNLYGHENEMGKNELRNENYPMADADEGNYLVAVLCGNWPGGHRDDVCAVAWLPSHRAIATSSHDQSFKIWPVPALPPPRVPKPAKGYRPILVSWPLFSTNRLNPCATRPVDSIHWLNEDTIVARTVDRIVTFQWLSYRRYFDPKVWDPLGDSVMPVPDPAHWHDIDDSRSLLILSNLLVAGQHTYHRTGFHAAFRPSQSEATQFAQNPNLVQDFLVAIPMASTMPEIVLYAPALAPPDPRPDFSFRHRKDHSDLEEEVAAGAEEMEEGPHTPDGQKRKRGGRPAGHKTQKAKVPSPEPESEVGTETASEHSENEYGEYSSSESDAVDDRKDGVIGERAVSRRRPRYTWNLRAPIWHTLGKPQGKPGAKGKAAPTKVVSLITCCAISPRGAKWILGVGQSGSVFIWRLADA